LIGNHEKEPSRFDQLCHALKEVRTQFNNHRTECLHVAARLRDGLSQYLEAPEGHVSLYANRGDFAGRKMDGPAAAMKLENDTFWHFGIVVDLYEEPGVLPYCCVAFDVRMKKTGRGFELFVDTGEEYQVTLDAAAAEDAGQLQSLFDHLFKFIVGRLDGAFEAFNTHGDSSRRFGF